MIRALRQYGEYLSTAAAAMAVFCLGWAAWHVPLLGVACLAAVMLELISLKFTAEGWGSFIRLLRGGLRRPPHHRVDGLPSAERPSGEAVAAPVNLSEKAAIVDFASTEIPVLMHASSVRRRSRLSKLLPALEGSFLALPTTELVRSETLLPVAMTPEVLGYYYALFSVKQRLSNFKLLYVVAKGKRLAGVLSPAVYYSGGAGTKFSDELYFGRVRQLEVALADLRIDELVSAAHISAGEQLPVFSLLERLRSDRPGELAIADFNATTVTVSIPGSTVRGQLVSYLELLHGAAQGKGLAGFWSRSPAAYYGGRAETKFSYEPYRLLDGVRQLEVALVDLRSAVDELVAAAHISAGEQLPVHSLLERLHSDRPGEVAGVVTSLVQSLFRLSEGRVAPEAYIELIATAAKVLEVADRESGLSNPRSIETGWPWEVSSFGGRSDR
jgi:hypothetical protein